MDDEIDFRKKYKKEEVEKILKDGKEYRSYQLIKLIANTGNSEYIKSFIEDREKSKEIGIEQSDIYFLIMATHDSDYIKSYIEDSKKRESLGIQSDDISSMIIATRDTEYMKGFIESIEKRERVGIDSFDAGSLFMGIRDIEYIKSFIENPKKREELDLDISFLMTDLIKETNDLEYYKYCIRRGGEIGLDFSDVNILMMELSKDDIKELVDEALETDVRYEDKGKKVKLPENMTIGVEIESNGEASNMIVKHLSNILQHDWETKKDASLIDGAEVTSPILTGNMDDVTHSIKKVCQKLNDLGQEATKECGGHIHIGSDYLTSPESWANLIEIWGNVERILYIISNKEGEIPRMGVARFAMPISRKLANNLSENTVLLNSIEDLKSFAKRTQNDLRYFGINFQNIGKVKNTIEFRLPNGTINADTWIENINLFGGIVRASEEMANIELKPKENRGQEEREKLRCLAILKDGSASQVDKLEALLFIVIPEEDRDIYRKRYRVNNRLIKKKTDIYHEIIEKTTNRPINIEKIKAKVFYGRERLTRADYNKGIALLSEKQHEQTH